ncbi:hypothetical protein [Thiococcus pfennigii]|uniref:hypothetical protein n=1 Tax=Thiococcus pfennigii TaxID=1057 RepID=UPI0019059389|nr:hypothetical protein [Thiococcus pfennigii]MBK1701568.1 hypothetical protein [Thiococcus pfennigii]MBK1731896.1 hypothetical protein [Thiococcus pfennigii]
MERATDITQAWEREATSATVEVADDFSDACGEGRVLGTKSASGHVRLGRDLERALSIDNGALRIAPLVQAGFGRVVLSYGPFVRHPGLSFAVFLLNGHNTSQDEPSPDNFVYRLRLWLRGSETEGSWKRLFQWARQARFGRALRQVRWWWRTRAGRDVAHLDENLAIGWYANELEADPRREGSGFVMHALGPENGELWAGAAKQRTRALRGVQNLPIYYVAIARAGGTVYYVSSVDGMAGIAAYPAMRPIALDDCELPERLYLGIHQGVLGQIGFRLDTRAYGVRVGQLGGYAAWFGGAHAAAALGVDGPASEAPTEAGLRWESAHAVDGGLGNGGAGFALLDPGAPSGLVFAYARVEGGSPTLGLVFRAQDAANHWRLEVTDGAAALVVVSAGRRKVVAARGLPEPATDNWRRLQVIDDGCRLMALVDGEQVQGAWVEDRRLADASKTGVFAAGARLDGRQFRRFEAHPRQVPIPAQFDMGAPWLRKGTLEVVADDFVGEAGDLDGRRVGAGSGQWRRVMGKGRIELTGAGSARVHARRDAPCPGRTAYCIDWPRADFADVKVTVTPAGTRAGDRERTTSGLILFQDVQNFVIANAWRSDSYPGGSVSTFFKFGGFEDIYDAVWTNVADRVKHGHAVELRLCSDTERYIVFLDDEPVLYRAYRDVYPDLPRFRIRKIGIIANWEFGNDTGSRFENFLARV